MNGADWTGKRVEVRTSDGELRQGAVMMVWVGRGHATVLLDDDGTGGVELARVDIKDLKAVSEV